MSSNLVVASIAAVKLPPYAFVIKRNKVYVSSLVKGTEQYAPYKELSIQQGDLIALNKAMLLVLRGNIVYVHDVKLNGPIKSSRTIVCVKGRNNHYTWCDTEEVHKEAIAPNKEMLARRGLYLDDKNLVATC